MMQIVRSLVSQKDGKESDRTSTFAQTIAEKKRAISCCSREDIAGLKVCGKGVMMRTMMTNDDDHERSGGESGGGRVGGGDTDKGGYVEEMVQEVPLWFRCNNCQSVCFGQDFQNLQFLRTNMLHSIGAER